MGEIKITMQLQYRITVAILICEGLHYYSVEGRGIMSRKSVLEVECYKDKHLK